MNTTRVYIDFEAITNPFARLVNLPSGTPYAYTLGLLNIHGQYQIKTFIIDFKEHHNLNSIWTAIKNAIVSDILEINNTVNLKEVVFVGHNPVLENKCLKKLFPENNVEPLISNTIVSLSKLTGKIFNIPYFNKIKKIIADSGDSELNMRIKDRNGVIAAFAGYWLYTKSIKNLRANDRRKRFLIKMNKNLLLKELKRYSHDDVNKMLYIVSHPNETETLLKELLYKRELIKQIKNLELDDNLTIKEIKEKIWTL